MSDTQQAPTTSTKRTVQFIFRVNCAEPGEKVLTPVYWNSHNTDATINAKLAERVTIIDDSGSDWQSVQFDWDNRTYTLHAGDHLIAYSDCTLHALVGVELTTALQAALIA